MKKFNIIISLIGALLISIIVVGFIATGKYFVIDSVMALAKITMKVALLGFIFFTIFVSLFYTNWRFIVTSSFIVFIITSILHLRLVLVSNKNGFQSLFTIESFQLFLSNYLFSMAAAVIGYLFFCEVFEKMKNTKILIPEIALYYLAFIVIIQVQYIVFATFAGPFFGWDFVQSTPYHHLIVLLVTIVTVIIFYFIQKNKATDQQSIIVQSTKAENISAQFQSLKNQLDPHFLFNSLNVLTGLIEENQDKAIDFTSSLSKIYRYVLEQKDKEVINVQEELGFAKSFVGLLKLRYENSIDFEMNEFGIMENEKIVPLSLQILLENAIKHNVVSPESVLKIKIYKELDMLVIENNYQPKQSIDQNTGIGLQNIITRYELVSTRKVEVYKDTKIFKVKIPLLTNKRIAMINNETENEAYNRAYKRTKELKKYYSDIATYFIVGLFLFFIDYIVTGGNSWWYFPVAGFVIAAFIDTVKVFGLGKDWEERKVNELLGKNKNRNKWS